MVPSAVARIVMHLSTEQPLVDRAYRLGLDVRTEPWHENAADILSHSVPERGLENGGAACELPISRAVVRAPA